VDWEIKICILYVMYIMPLSDEIAKNLFYLSAR